MAEEKGTMSELREGRMSNEVNPQRRLCLSEGERVVAEGLVGG